MVSTSHVQMALHNPRGAQEGGKGLWQCVPHPLLPPLLRQPLACHQNVTACTASCEVLLFEQHPIVYRGHAERLGKYELRRQVKGPRDGFTLDATQLQTVAPIPYDVLKEGVVQ